MSLPVLMVPLPWLVVSDAGGDRGIASAPQATLAAAEAGIAADIATPPPMAAICRASRRDIVMLSSPLFACRPC
jgi:hypothetical protein